MPQIPFRVGEIVSGRGLFTDRAEEVKRIRRAIRDRERLLVYGERRQGKSSAIRRAVDRESGRGTTVIWIELWTVRSMSELLRRLVSAVPLGWNYLHRLIGPRGPLHNIDRLDVGAIDAGYMARWIRSRLEASGVESEPPIGEAIVTMAGPITEHRVQLARECFVQGLGSGTLVLEDVQRAFATVVAARSGAYEILWADLARSHQGVVRAVSAGATELQGAETRRLFGLPSASGVAKAVDVLRSRAILSSREPIRLADPFFAEWVRRRAMPEPGRSVLPPS